MAGDTGKTHPDTAMVYNSIMIVSLERESKSIQFHNDDVYGKRL